MRSQWRFVGLLLLLALAGGCDTIAPLQIEEQTYQLQIVGTSTGSIPVYAVYDMYEDGVGERFLFCQTAGRHVRLNTNEMRGDSCLTTNRRDRKPIPKWRPIFFGRNPKPNFDVFLTANT